MIGPYTRSPDFQCPRERDGSWQTFRYIPYTRISGDLDSTVEEYEKTLRCKLVVSRFVSVSKLRALCKCRVDDTLMTFVARCMGFVVVLLRTGLILVGGASGGYCGTGEWLTGWLCL